MIETYYHCLKVTNKPDRMKTYTFTFPSGWIGGDGVVVAKDVDSAVLLANEAISNVPLNRVKKPLTKEDMKEVLPNSVKIINDGDY